MLHSSHPPLRGALFLGTASLLWGIAFWPQAITVEGLDALWATALRFLMAAPLALVAQRVASGTLRPAGVPLRSAFLLGTLLYGAFVLQTEALRHTQVARVSLITGTYAILTPLLSPLFGLRRPRALHFVGAVIAVIGLSGLVGSFSAAVRAPMNVGDVMTLGHALLSAVHLILVGKLLTGSTRVDPFAFNVVQLTTMAALALPTALVFGAPFDTSVLDGRTLIALGYLAVFSSVIAFSCQLIGQQHASPSMSAVVFLLESPIGAATAMIVLKERMSGTQALGAVALLLGVAVSLYGEVRAQLGKAQRRALTAHDERPSL